MQGWLIGCGRTEIASPAYRDALVAACCWRRDMGLQVAIVPRRAHARNQPLLSFVSSPAIHLSVQQLADAVTATPRRMQILHRDGCAGYVIAQDATLDRVQVVDHYRACSNDVCASSSLEAYKGKTVQHVRWARLQAPPPPPTELADKCARIYAAHSSDVWQLWSVCLHSQGCQVGCNNSRIQRTGRHGLFNERKGGSTHGL